jgi:hypothetical protein
MGWRMVCPGVSNHCLAGPREGLAGLFCQAARELTLRHFLGCDLETSKRCWAEVGR